MSSDTQRQRILAALAVAVLIVTGVLLYRSAGRKPANDPGRSYYVDLNNGILLDDSASRLAPFATDSGGTAVRAFVYACGDCASPADRKIAWVQKYTDEAIKLLAGGMQNLAPTQMEAVDRGTLVAVWDNGKAGDWQPMASPVGSEVTESWRRACGGQAKVCSP